MGKEKKIRRQIYIKGSTWNDAKKISKKLPGYKGVIDGRGKPKDGSASFAINYATEKLIREVNDNK